MPARGFSPFSAYSRVVLTGLSAILALFLGVTLLGGPQPAPALADTVQNQVQAAVSAAPAVPPVTEYKAAAAAQFARAQAVAAAHAAHQHHLAVLAQIAAQKAAALAAEKAAARAEAVANSKPPAPSPSASTQTQAASVTPASSSPAAVTYAGGVLTSAEVGQLWLSAGGAAWAESKAVEIAYCESGFNPRAYNPSGATGIWQILGSVVAGDLTNPSVNAANAVAKFDAAGDSFSPWVCQ